MKKYESSRQGAQCLGVCEGTALLRNVHVMFKALAGAGGEFQAFLDPKSYRGIQGFMSYSLNSLEGVI